MNRRNFLKMIPSGAIAAALVALGLRNTPAALKTRKLIPWGDNTYVTSDTKWFIPNEPLVCQHSGESPMCLDCYAKRIGINPPWRTQEIIERNIALSHAIAPKDCVK